jgi:hypothetical protein
MTEQEIRENQLKLAKELGRGKVVTPCIFVDLKSGPKIVSKCDYLDTSSGCTKDEGYVLKQEGVVCPDDKGEIIISSQQIPDESETEAYRRELATMPIEIQPNEEAMLFTRLS